MLVVVVVELGWRKFSIFTQCTGTERGKEGPLIVYITNIVMISLISPYGICMLDLLLETGKYLDTYIIYAEENYSLQALFNKIWETGEN